MPPLLAQPGPLFAQPTASVRFDGVDDAARVIAPAKFNLSGAVSVVALLRWEPGGSAFDSTPDTIRDGAWHLLAGTYDPAAPSSARVKFYRDGALIHAAPGPASLKSGAGDFLIGRLGGFYQFDGWLAEVAVFNRALGDDEVVLLQQAWAPASARYGSGPGDLRPFAIRRREEPGPGWLRLVGPGRYADSTSGEPERGPDAAVTTASDTEARSLAAGALRRRALTTLEGELIAPVHAGLELFDIVAVHDSTDYQLYRVGGFDVDFARGPHSARYTQRLHLGPA